MLPEEPMTKRAGAGDRLSALPDALLHAIMYHLPARQVVQTSALSRRWRDLWCSTPFVGIDQREFGIAVFGRKFPEEKWAKLENFTTNLLLFHCNAVSLDEFRLLASYNEQSERDVDRWMRRGIKYSPRVLDIRLPTCGPRAKLPHLGSSFCRLKILKLYHVSLDGLFAELLSSRCSVLEDLELMSCGIWFREIMSPTLKRLAVVSCFHRIDSIFDHAICPVIAAPALASLHVDIQSCCYKGGLSLRNTDSLVKASIYVEFLEYFPGKNQRRLLSSLSNVTTLELSGFETMAFLNEKSDNFPIFPVMRILSLRQCFLDECDQNDKLEALGSFLQNAPCLENLTLQNCMFDVDSSTAWDAERRSITLPRHNQKTFQCQKLNLIEVIYEDDHDHRLIELMWGLGRSLPDARIKLTRA